MAELALAKKDVKIQQMAEVSIEGQEKTGEKVLTGGVAWVDGGTLSDATASRVVVNSEANVPLKSIFPPYNAL